MVLIVMGVAGAGKTTVGRLLAEELSWTFRDADEFHPASNIEKMSCAIALEDADRTPWLAAMRAAIETWLRENTNAVLTCSCLKAAFRQTLVVDPAQVRFVYLKGSFDLIEARLHQRTHHYLKAQLLQSQFAILEEPQDAIIVDVSDPPAVIATTIRKALGI
ncbi:MAG: gluconokinase [Nitrospirota bacterium]